MKKGKFRNGMLALNALRQTVGVMTTRQLRRLKVELASLTPSNCDWLLYQLRDAIADLAVNELRRRERRRRQLPLL